MLADVDGYDYTTDRAEIQVVPGNRCRRSRTQAAEPEPLVGI